MRERKSLTNQVAPRYRGASGEEKKRMLDEFVSNTGYNRKYAITLLNGWGKKTTVIVNGKPVTFKGGNVKRRKGGGRKPVYGPETIEALSRIWLFFGSRCAKILVSLIRDQMSHLEAHPDFGVTEPVKEQLLRISSATIDRRLRERRKELQLLPKRTYTKRGPMIKSQVPVRVHWPMEDRLAGFFEADTVHHCSDSTAGQYCLTLTLVDVGSGWVHLHALLNKARSWMLKGLQGVHETLPFPLRGIDSDSGGEFINHWIVDWAVENDIYFTRGRSCHKNDNCFVEQKNDACVRQYVGYARYETQAECDALAALYEVLCPLLNYFIPTAKLISKEGHGAKIKKVYEQPTKTPYQRLLTDPSLSDEIKAKLTETYRSLNPIELQQRVNEALNTLDVAYSKKLQQKESRRIS
ncbi:MAG: transposase [Sphaerochaeta sp.]|jgi:hypothetical protein